MSTRRQSGGAAAMAGIAIGALVTVGSVAVMRHQDSRPTTTTTTVNGAGDNEAIVASAPGTACGVERWRVKTGMDADVGKVDTRPFDSTVAALGKISPPASPASRSNSRWPGETRTVRVHAVLTEFKMEADSDYHLVLRDGPATMIAEIPSPNCVGASRFKSQLATVRAVFDARYKHVSSTNFTHVNQPVTVTGVFFFDAIHGQAGVAKNGAEIHPVTVFVFN